MMPYYCAYMWRRTAWGGKRGYEKMDKVKVFLTAMVAGLSSLLGVLFIPVVLMVGSNIIDYVTGIMAAPHRGHKIDSYKGIRGITKKVCMWLLVVVGFIIDQLILYVTGTVGVHIPFTYMFACIVAVWITCNELISILENMNDIGVNFPPFLLKVITYIKDQSETIADKELEKEK